MEILKYLVNKGADLDARNNREVNFSETEKTVIYKGIKKINF